MSNINKRNLTDRESAVLCALVFEFITTGKAVGSRSFVQKYSFNLSPATMRNIMADLESLGFLMHMHTSSGRIPTDIGYRYYVDSLLESYNFIMDETLRIKEEFLQREIKLDMIFSSITKMLSMVSTYAGIVISPKPDYTVVKHIELVPLGNNSILFIMVTRTDIVLNKKVSISEILSQDELHKMSKFLTIELNGFSVNDVKCNVLKKLRKKNGPNSEYQIAVDIAELALNSFDKQDVFVEGVQNILHIPEMNENNKLRSFLHLIENRDNLLTIMQKSIRQEGVQTYIGEEIEDENASGCSLIASSYKIGNNNVGTLGIIGPTRMNYKKVLPLVDYASKIVSDILTKISK